jgi:pimeloyl-ACP methyl ester carboxylesterase
MTDARENSTEVADWFTAAIAQQPEAGTVEVDGTPITYRSWGHPGGQNVLLVHGGAAHSRWWDHIAPLIATGRRVVALDLSGHGDSGRRDAYSLDRWADEVLAVADAGGVGRAPVVIGHSLGGIVTLALASRRDTPLGGAIVVDSPIGTPGSAERGEPAMGRMRLYETREEAVSRFRPVPAQTSLPYVFDHIAAHSVAAVDGGFSWKFDDRIFDGRVPPPAEVTEFQCRVTFFRAEHGLVAPGARELIERAGGSFVELPGAGHAPMLDQPLALVTGIRSVLGEWADVSTTPSRSGTVETGTR